MVDAGATGEPPGDARAAITTTVDGRPDFSGTYDTGTLTPLVRPARYGERLFLTEAEARLVEEKERALIEASSSPTDRRDATSSPAAAAPEARPGGAPEPSSVRDIGALIDARLKDHHAFNRFWFDRGDQGSAIGGKHRTSIITLPADGSLPAMTRAGRERLTTLVAAMTETEARGAAEPGPYDDPELRPLPERCLAGVNSVAGPPTLPVLYNNLKKIIMTPDHVVILAEMIHDARIVRMNEEHRPPEIRSWLGDAVGHWDGETLVIDTTGFTHRPGLPAASEQLHVVERLSRLDRNTLLYRFTVEDPATWTAPWSGEYTWSATGERLFEYACHEGNHTLGSILRGARLLEAEARDKPASRRNR